MWNDGEGLSVTAKRIIIYLFSILLTIALFYIAYTFILPKAQDPNDPANIENYIGIMAVILTIIGYMLKVTENLVSRQVETDLMLSFPLIIIILQLCLLQKYSNQSKPNLHNLSL